MRGARCRARGSCAPGGSCAGWSCTVEGVGLAGQGKGGRVRERARPVGVSGFGRGRCWQSLVRHARDVVQTGGRVESEGLLLGRRRGRRRGAAQALLLEERVHGDALGRAGRLPEPLWGLPVGEGTLAAVINRSDGVRGGVNQGGELAVADGSLRGRWAQSRCTGRLWASLAGAAQRVESRACWCANRLASPDARALASLLPQVLARSASLDARQTRIRGKLSEPRPPEAVPRFSEVERTVRGCRHDKRQARHARMKGSERKT